MRIIHGGTALIWCAVLFSSNALAQYYSFEEACRNAGLTTGACAPKGAPASKGTPGFPIGCVPTTGNAFHAEKASSGCLPTSLSPAEDAQILVELIGLPNIAKINDLRVTIGRAFKNDSGEPFDNAVATFYNGSRIIIHNPAWAKTATAEFYLVLGHEAGHHFCGHDLESDPFKRKRFELEADRFSGAAIKRFEEYHRRSFLKDALKSATRLYSEAGHQSHPDRAARIEAIMLGYNAGSPCAELAKGIPGYAPKQR